MYCVFLGKAVQTVNPPSGSVGTAQLADSSVSLAKLSATGTKDATTFLRGDNTFNAPPLGGITEADMFRLTSDLNSNADPISSNLERVDDATFSKIGTGMSVSSGRYTFPSTGLYFVQYSIIGESNNDGFSVYMDATTDNSSYDLVAQVSVGGPSGYNVGGTQQTFINVTDTSNVKVSFRATSMAGNNNTRIYGDTDFNATTFTFIRLGDSQ
jgi:hypothetical protein